MLAQIYAAIAAFVKKNPAVVSYVLTAATAALAHFGFHVSATAMAGVMGVVITLLHAWLHGQTKN